MQRGASIHTVLQHHSADFKVQNASKPSVKHTQHVLHHDLR